MFLNKDTVFTAYDDEFGQQIIEVLNRRLPATDNLILETKDDIVRIFANWVVSPKKVISLLHKEENPKTEEQPNTSPSTEDIPQ